MDMKVILVSWLEPFASQSQNAKYEIWAQLAYGLQRRSPLEMMAGKARACLSYKFHPIQNFEGNT